MTDCRVLPGQGCRNYHPDHRRAAHPDQSFTEYRLSNNGDGTWAAREYLLKRDRVVSVLNAEHFPTREEAEVFIEAMHSGSGVRESARIRVHEWRLLQARTAGQQ